MSCVTTSPTCTEFARYPGDLTTSLLPVGMSLSLYVPSGWVIVTAVPAQTVAPTIGLPSGLTTRPERTLGTSLMFRFERSATVISWEAKPSTSTDRTGLGGSLSKLNAPSVFVVAVSWRLFVTGGEEGSGAEVTSSVMPGIGVP